MKAFALFTFIVLTTNAFCTTKLIGSIASIPFYSDNLNSPYKELFKELSLPFWDVELSVDYYPYKRSLNMLLYGETDFHYPVAMSDNKLPKGLRYSTFSTHSAEFGLFYRSNLTNKITPDLIQEGNTGLLVEAIAPHRDLYFKEYRNLRIAPCASCGLKKIAGGRIDGFIFEKYAGLKALHVAKITGVKYKKLKSFPIHFLLRDSESFTLYNEVLRQKFLKAVTNSSLHHMFKTNITRNLTQTNLVSKKD